MGVEDVAGPLARACDVEHGGTENRWVGRGGKIKAGTIPEIVHGIPVMGS